ncbi:selenocysteine-specific translation elongation factor [Eoetvoesiella caeni]
MIIGTAGHIDHGKTTLVRALTGVETDRLKEEKARGISIELGYAYTPLDNGDILGFIDVPGHERLVHTMAAGASGIDFGLLVVAADDGVMPQTREHLAILSLLGVRHGAVALNKVDRADTARQEAVRREIAELTAGTFLADAPVFPVNAAAPDEPGIAALRGYLHARATGMAAHNADGLFRLAVDRVFTLQGHGTVVTGTVHAGAVRVGNEAAELRLMPAGQPVRVRSIHAQNQSSQQGLAGQRCALNLAGVSKESIERGAWIADARCFEPSRHVDVSMQLLGAAGQPVRAWSPLHIHLGAAHYVAHIVPLEPASLLPGHSGTVQLVFDEPVCAMPGDRYIARNAQANQTVGGGVVLDANAPDRKRRAPQRLAWLGAMQAMLDGAGIEVLLAQAKQGLDENTLMHLTGCDTRGLAPPAEAVWIAGHGGQAPRTLILREYWAALADKVEAVLEVFHRTSPDEPGVESSRLRRMALPALSQPLWLSLRDEMLGQGRMARNGSWLHLAGHAVVLSDAEAGLVQQLLPLIHAGKFDPPWVRDLAQSVGQPEDMLRQVLRKLVRRGELYQVVRDLFYHHERIAALAALVGELGGTEGIGAAKFRDATGLGRKRAIQVLEFFDRIGYTRRLRDKHVLRDEGMAFAGPSQ